MFAAMLASRCRFRVTAGHARHITTAADLLQREKASAIRAGKADGGGPEPQRRSQFNSSHRLVRPQILFDWPLFAGRPIALFLRLHSPSISSR